MGFLNFKSVRGAKRDGGSGGKTPQGQTEMASALEAELKAFVASEINKAMSSLGAEVAQVKVELRAMCERHLAAQITAMESKSKGKDGSDAEHKLAQPPLSSSCSGENLQKAFGSKGSMSLSRSESTGFVRSVSKWESTVTVREMSRAESRDGLVRDDSSYSLRTSATESTKADGLSSGMQSPSESFDGAETGTSALQKSIGAAEGEDSWPAEPDSKLSKRAQLRRNSRLGIEGTMDEIRTLRNDVDALSKELCELWYHVHQLEGSIYVNSGPTSGAASFNKKMSRKPSEASATSTKGRSSSMLSLMDADNSSGAIRGSGDSESMSVTAGSASPDLQSRVPAPSSRASSHDGERSR